MGEGKDENLSSTRGSKTFTARISRYHAGNFDHIHLSPQTLIRKTVEDSKTGLSHDRLTFEPHPLKVRPGACPSPHPVHDDKMALIQSFGVDIVIAEF
jgi:FAD synthase